MSARAVVLLTGSVDSRLAARLLQEQGVQVVGLHLRAVCQPDSKAVERAAHELGVELVVFDQDERYLSLLQRPSHGYGRGMNPCLDCRIHVARLAREYMQRTEADFVASGEVLGQKPLTQKRRDLELLAQASGLDDHLLRPLSALRLTPTAAERNGLVDRGRLKDFSGRNRKPQLALARELGLQASDDVTPRCLLAEAAFAAQLTLLFERRPEPRLEELALIGIGRHVRGDDHTTIVLGRTAEENRQLEQLFSSTLQQDVALLMPANFRGPTVLLAGASSPNSLTSALTEMRAATKQLPDHARVVCKRPREADRELPLFQ